MGEPWADERRFDLVVATTLTVGVGVSATLITVGFVGSLVVGWSGSLWGATPAEEAATDFAGLLARLQAGEPLAIAQLGLLALIATPVVRVAVSLLGFVLERDGVYVAITGVVLAILMASLFLFR